MNNICHKIDGCGPVKYLLNEEKTILRDSKIATVTFPRFYQIVFKLKINRIEKYGNVLLATNTNANCGSCSSRSTGCRLPIVYVSGRYISVRYCYSTNSNEVVQDQAISDFMTFGQWHVVKFTATRNEKRFEIDGKILSRILLIKNMK